MKQYQLTKIKKDQADKWNLFNGNRNTITRDMRYRPYANFAEMCFKEEYPQAEFVGDRISQYDFIIKNYKVEVKCQVNKYNPKPDYYISIFDSQIDYANDFYFFYWMNQETEILYYLGSCSKAYFKANAIFLKAGDAIPETNITLERDNYILKIKDLQFK